MAILDRQPLAFMSYVRSDDDHDGGRITRLRERLEGEVKMHTGRPFSIFQDRNDIQWGQQWQQRISQSLADVTFLISIVTPSFFQSPACRDEFNAFTLREKTIGVARLILPILYLDCDELTEPSSDDPIAQVLRERNWTDWRHLRFRGFEDQQVMSELAQMAKTLKETMAQLNAIIGKAAAVAPSTGTISLENEAKSETDLIPDEGATYFIPEARADAELDKTQFDTVVKNPYYVYTRRYDEVVSARELAAPDELVRLHRYLAKHSPTDKAYRAHAAAISTQLSGAPGPPSISVSFLLDNSGSLRGRPIVNLAGTILGLAEWFDRWQIRNEILGFTTRAWRGGQSRELWLSDGKPNLPGRLNDLRHVVYKTFDEPIISAAPNFGVMMREGLLKENVDGEALLWAYARLLQERSATKLLFLFSDGAPVDDSTLSVQQDNFLYNHLLQVVEKIRSEQKARLTIVGIEHDVTALGPDAYTVDGERIALPVVNALRELTKSRT